MDAHGDRCLHGELDVIAKRLAVHTEMLGFKQVGHIGGFCDLIFDKQLEFFHDNLLKGIVTKVYHKTSWNAPKFISVFLLILQHACSKICSLNKLSEVFHAVFGAL